MRLLIPFISALTLTSFAASPLEDRGRPVSQDPARTPEETVKLMKVPAGFRVQVVTGEPDVVQPIAYTTDDRGRMWVLTNTNYPTCPGEPKDSILIFEDTDGDGKADKRTVFYDKVTFASGIAVGFGGVYVGAPPNLLFFPDKNGDDKPDSEPVKLLDGWGKEDTHETLNDFTWGPDGWLYGTQGVFTFSNVGKPGAPAGERVKINAGVWRYHPTRHVFERYCEGASNQWGLDWNDHGEAVFAACVIPHLWQAMPGARYVRQGGQHENKFTYDDIKTIAWGRYEKAAYCGAMFYLGGAWPTEWRDAFFFHDIHMNKQRAERLIRDGSGVRSEKIADFVESSDKWFRGLSPQLAPDGNVYVNDWYDRVPCHQQREYTDRTNGRIYKIVHESTKPVTADLSRATEAQLVHHQLSSNEWFVRHARRILQERGLTADGVVALEQMLAGNADDTRQLRALWTLHSCGALSEATGLAALRTKSEYVRGWAALLLCENEKPSEAVLGALAGLAKSDPSPVVRRQVASAAQRIPIAQRWPVLFALADHAEDAGDRNLPLLLWYAAEPAVAADPARAAELLVACKLPKIQEFISRRMAASAK